VDFWYRPKQVFVFLHQKWAFFSILIHKISQEKKEKKKESKKHFLYGVVVV